MKVYDLNSLAKLSLMPPYGKQTCIDQDLIDLTSQKFSRRLSDIAVLAGIHDELHLLNPSHQGYTLYLSPTSEIFWIHLLSNKTEMKDLRKSIKYSPLKRSVDSNICDFKIIHIFEELLSLFKLSNVSEDDLRRIASKMDCSLGYTIRKKRTTLTCMFLTLESSIEEKFSRLNSTGFSSKLSRSDLYYWLLYFQADFDLLINKYCELFKIMEDLRDDELTELACESYKASYNDDFLENQLYTLAKQCEEKSKSDEKMKNAQSALQKTLNSSLPKPGKLQEIVTTITEQSSAIAKRTDEIMHSCIKDAFSDTDDIEQQIAIAFKDSGVSDITLMSSNKLLQQALLSQKENCKHTQQNTLPTTAHPTLSQTEAEIFKLLDDTH